MEQINDIRLTLLYTGSYQVSTWWNYKEITSPFYRLYLIKKGEAVVIINQHKYTLKAGDLFLVPKYATASYQCHTTMEHSYICFFDDFWNGNGIINSNMLNLRFQASSLDYLLMERFIELNPFSSLPSVDPKEYDNNSSLFHQGFVSNAGENSPESLESAGILQQLFSRFLTKQFIHQQLSANSFGRLNLVIHHINNHLDKKITVTDLAAIMCVSPDHFTKIFKKIIGMTAGEFIQSRRIEWAQRLLIGSSLSIQEVAIKIGIGNLSQFSKLFSKKMNCSPKDYREEQFIQFNNTRPLK
ncbi:MAG: AraC family transcriptional regulator [Parabacteroides sp.]|nr:AraC family transcriptional regulator [Parabacteroides sp.]